MIRLNWCVCALILLLTSSGFCVTIENWTNADTVVDIVVGGTGNEMWAVSHGGLVKWNVTEESFEKFTTATGLRDNWNLCGTAGLDGEFWFGTLGGGLSQFDDEQWNHWTKADDGLPYDEIRCLDVDEQNRLWAGFGAAFGNGIGILNGDIWQFITQADGLSHNRINVIETDATGAWIGTIDGLDRITGTQVTASYSTADGLPDSDILSLAPDGAGGQWIGTQNGLARMTVSGIVVFHTEDGLPDECIQALHLDMSGVLRVGTPRGAAFYNSGIFTSIDMLKDTDIHSIESLPNGDILYSVYGRGIEVFRNDLPIKCFSVDDLLPGCDVRVVTFNDYDGKIWFGTTAAGVGWFDGTEWWIDESGCGIENSQVRDVVIDQDGVKWYSTFDDGVYSYNDQNWTHYSDQDVLPANAVIAGFVDEDNSKWFATWGGGIVRFDGVTWTVIDENDGLPTNLTYDVKRDKRGDYWFALDSGVIQYRDGVILNFFTEDDGLVFHRVYDIAVGSDNSLWFGACKGMSHYKDGIFTNYYAGDGQLVHYRVRDVVFDPWGVLWIATGGGINIFDGESFTSYVPPDGVAGYETYCVTRDNHGNFWFGSEGGLTRIQPDPPSCPTSGVSIIMPSHEYFSGDNCRLDMLLCNTSQMPISDHLLFVILDIYGMYFFGPGFTLDFDVYNLPDLLPGEKMLEIIPDFLWPSSCGSADQIYWYAAMTTPDTFEIVG
ncbi:hypothetical protein K8T06_02525, partial [bacterium]|nr:hypothetical protein [bacterium]